MFRAAVVKSPLRSEKPSNCWAFFRIRPDRVFLGILVRVGGFHCFSIGAKTQKSPDVSELLWSKRERLFDQPISLGDSGEESIPHVVHPVTGMDFAFDR
jgi:hypothetical protein